jgi:glycosyltransferase involved in cell wall biosynthesis
MIEAMAWGKPVIAFNRRSVPEVTEDGLTGYIVEDETGRRLRIAALVT